MGKTFNLEVLCETKGSAGFDIASVKDYVVESGKTQMIQTGLFFADGIKDTEYMALMSRSGLAFKHSVFVLNAPGIVDADYKGEICVILHNASDKPFVVNIGDRVAQGVIMEHKTHDYVETKDSNRNGGFGSTGI